MRTNNSNMNSSRRASGSQSQMGLNSPPSSGVTSVWVGTRSSKDPPRSSTKVTSQSAPTEKETADHRKSRQISTGTGDGDYIVVSVRNSITESSTPFKRRNSTVIPPMSDSLSASRSFSSSDETNPGSSCPLTPVTSVGNLPLQTSSSLNNTLIKSAANCHANIENKPGNSENIPANVTNRSGTTSNILSGNNGIFGNSSLCGGGSSGTPLANTVNGFDLNLLNSANNISGNMHSLYSAGSSLPSVKVLASSLDQTLNPSQATSFKNLKQPQPVSQKYPFEGFTQNQFLPMPFVRPPLILSQTNPFFGPAQTPFLPIPFVGPPQTCSQTNPLFGPAQIPFLPMPPVSPLDMLSAMLAMNQPFLPPGLQLPTFSTLFPTPPLPLMTMPGSLPTQTGVPPVGPYVTHRKSAPLLNQNPTAAETVSVQAREATREMKSSKRPSLTSSCGDQEDHQMTTELGCSVPSSPSPSSTSRRDSVFELESLADEVYTPGVTVDPCYDLPPSPHTCMRCGKTVYTMEKQVGPVRRVLYHKACFTCSACGTALTLNNYYLNDDDKEDLNVYCCSHKPLVRHNPLDSEALLLQQAVLTLPDKETNT